MNDTLTPEQVAAWRQERVQRAADAIAAILKEHDCDLRPVISVTPDGRLDAAVTIVAR